MTMETIRKAIAQEKMRCPECGQPIRKFDKFVEMLASAWDGPDSSLGDTAGSKVTLICANGSCSWKERTEYWTNYLD